VASPEDDVSATVTSTVVSFTGVKSTVVTSIGMLF
jgi:hypothetical protein